jgi:hypothetical protein
LVNNSRPFESWVMDVDLPLEVHAPPRESSPWPNKQGARDASADTIRKQKRSGMLIVRSERGKVISD